MSWLNASISVSKMTFGFSKRHDNNVHTRREYPKAAAKCKMVISLKPSLLHGDMNCVT